MSSGLATDPTSVSLPEISVTAQQPASLTDSQALINTAKQIGANPLDLATVMSYETGGTFSPSITNPSGHTGLIQFGRNEQQAYGASPNQSFQQQLPAVASYLQDRGFQPGMGLLDLYSTINAGRPGLYNASDAGNGGAPGTVLDKVQNQMGPHQAKAAAFLGGQFQPQMPASVGGAAQPTGVTPTSSTATTAVPSADSAAAPAAADQPRQASPYDGVAKALQAAAGGKSQQKQSGGTQQPQAARPHPIGLQQARQLFDASRFYTMLQGQR